MPSSTSSSEIRRPVPERPWLGYFALALALTAGLLIAWELHVRGEGYRPNYNDTPELWARERDRVGPGSLVLIGSSRIVFDLDMDFLEERHGSRPVHLGIVGSCPRPMLANLARDEAFRGTLLVGVTPGLFFAAGGPPVSKSVDWLKARGTRSPSQRLGLWLSHRLEEHLAFLQADDLSLKGLLRNLDIPNRPGAVSPRLPPYLAALRGDRSMRMTERLATDEAFQRRVQDIWKALVQAAPPMTPEAQVAVREKILGEVTRDVERLRARGVRLVFLRLPSTGWFRDFERRTTPREDYWDLLLARTGAPGVHFEDHEDLRGFPCPEWSHLRAEDVPRFTRALWPRVEPHLAGPGSP